MIPLTSFSLDVGAGAGVAAAGPLAAAGCGEVLVRVSCVSASLVSFASRAASLYASHMVGSCS